MKRVLLLRRLSRLDGGPDKGVRGLSNSADPVQDGNGALVVAGAAATMGTSGDKPASASPRGDDASTGCAGTGMRRGGTGVRLWERGGRGDGADSFTMACNVAMV